METAVTKGVVRGRPHGGCGIFVKKSLNSAVNFHLLKERFVILCIGNILLINIYFPSVISDNDYNVVVDLLSQIEFFMKTFSDKHVIWAGDHNVNLASGHQVATLYRNFFKTFNLSICDNKLSKNANILSYTFFQETLNRFSYIDYFIVSSSLLSQIVNFDVIDCAFNLSDHNPIMLEIQLDNELCVKKGAASPPNSRDVKYTLRWDHAKLDQYYLRTFEYCSIIVKELDVFEAELNEMNPNINPRNISAVKHKVINENIEYYYSQLTNSLVQAANETIPRKKINFFKYWWDAEADQLKQESISSHGLWV